MKRPKLIAALAAALVLAGSALAVTPQEQARIQERIRKELVTLPFYTVFDHFAFEMTDGKVTLHGKVTRPTLKTDAERAVRRIEGIRDVDNKVVVLPVSPNDDEIRVATFRAIYGHSMLNRYAIQAVPPIHIVVENGNVTLEGVVNTEQEKNIAGIQANQVPGVFSVTNNIRVDG